MEPKRPVRTMLSGGDGAEAPAGTLVVIGSVFLLLYVLLDYASFVQPFQSFGITPWNPSTGLAYALILIFGRRFLPLLAIAPFLAELAVRGFPTTLPVLTLLSLVIGVGVAVPTMILRTPSARFDATLASPRDVILLIAIGMLGAAAIASSYVAILASAGLLSWTDFPSAALRYWVGDVIGIAVVTPFLLLLAARRYSWTISLEAVAQLLMIMTALWIVFVSADEPQIQLFYVLFLPVIWIAFRHGLEGTCLGLVATQLGLIASVKLQGDTIDVTSYQSVMLVLALSALTLGAVVSERQRAELKLRLQQEAQARLARLASLGEFSAALAHEINQPLAAAATYSRLVADALEATRVPELENARDAAKKAIAQVQRAADVVRRLRELVRRGRSQFTEVSVARLINDSLDLLRPEIDRFGASVEVHLPNEPLIVSADMLHIQLVIANLVRNALEALSEAGLAGGRIQIEVEAAQSGEVVIHVRDNGPGFAADQLDRPFEPFMTSRAGGLGMGLALSRSIIEAHGGRMWIENAPAGAVVHFTLKRTTNGDR